ncbi:hypothetical protein [Kibdelosporangium phytohabitans]|uniref:hypothetical protein n=1 Tax=Kibdelosporangium phytohabitans TaxID=860235 RepID=UPI0012FC47B6|nr:hypothetical protein [Kibdelosporangium phytohabitans]MBE1471781.1 uncharacterized membrane protein (UPF0136 family) [Kibdelosporangium phytohabitans]
MSGVLRGVNDRRGRTVLFVVASLGLVRLLGAGRCHLASRDRHLSLCLLTSMVGVMSGVLRGVNDRRGRTVLFVVASLGLVRLLGAGRCHLASRDRHLSLCLLTSMVGVMSGVLRGVNDRRGRTVLFVVASLGLVRPLGAGRCHLASRDRHLSLCLLTSMVGAMSGVLRGVGDQRAEGAWVRRALLDLSSRACLL